MVKSARAVRLAPTLALLARRSPAGGGPGHEAQVGWCARTVRRPRRRSHRGEVGWLKAGRDRRRTGADAGVDGLREERGGPGSRFGLPSVEPLAVAARRASRSRSSTRRTRATSTASRCRRTARSGTSRTSSASDRRDPDGVGRRARGPGARARPDARSGQGGDDRRGRRGRADGGDGPRRASGRLSQFDTQYAMVENAGAKFRHPRHRVIDRFPSNGSSRSRRRCAQPQGGGGARAELRQGNGVRHRQPRGRDPDPLGGLPGDASHRQGRGDALGTNQVLQARAQNWRLEKAGGKRWGEKTPRRTTGAYADFMRRPASQAGGDGAGS